MISFLEVCENTRKKLDRQLSEAEIAFLRWMHERFEEEHQNKDVVNIKSQLKTE